MQHIMTLAETSKVDMPGLDISVFHPEGSFASVSRIVVDGAHHRIKSTHSDRIYVILTGEGWFEVDGETTQVGPDDVIFLPKETGYSYGGVMQLFLVHSPGFLAGTDVALPS